jgi:hypothetical protein
VTKTRPLIARICAWAYLHTQAISFIGAMSGSPIQTAGSNSPLIIINGSRRRDVLLTSVCMQKILSGSCREVSFRNSKACLSKMLCARVGKHMDEAINKFASYKRKLSHAAFIGRLEVWSTGFSIIKVKQTAQVSRPPFAKPHAFNGQDQDRILRRFVSDYFCILCQHWSKFF